jgi:hypothetical protein
MHCFMLLLQCTKAQMLHFLFVQLSSYGFQERLLQVFFFFPSASAYEFHHFEDDKMMACGALIII